MSDSQTQEVLQLFFRHQPRIKGAILASLPDFAEEENDFRQTFLVVSAKAPGGISEQTSLRGHFASPRFK